MTGLSVARVDVRIDGTLLLDGVDCTAPAGSVSALIGPNGAGKSTLLRALAGIDHEAQGTGEIALPQRSAVIFQDARLLPWLRVLDNVLLGQPREARPRAMQALEEVGLARREQSWPHELSGGEQQRVALARALVREPDLLLADEPFGALDALTRIQMHELLRRLSERHKPAVLLVTHDIDEALALADRIVMLDGGRISAELQVPGRGDRTLIALQRKRLLAMLGVD